MELQTLAVDHFALHQRWFALEVGDQRYALDLGSVRTVFYQPLSEPSGEENRAPNLSSVFLNVRSVIVHEGAPVFLLSPSQVFSCNELPLDPEVHNLANVAATELPWVVILQGDSLSSVGVRVGRASGPFRLTEESITGGTADGSPRISQGGQRWLAVRSRARFMDGLYGDAT